MDSIKIIATPPGQAPEEVRREWVGLTIPLPQQETGGFQMGVLGGKAQNLGSYQVLSRDAFALLLAKSQPAFHWFVEHGFFGSYLVFAREVCEFLPGVETVVDHGPLGMDNPDESD
ncbi:hypothetical protein A3I99_00865 [Candidatus Kaiserbacteria bacterium RIFCSPLOWO2_02_FULL_45_11b]|uniref:Uncharacterized protein n=1 Tax=Candidatus Kaiserbacteria bacterium RIFCSPLOWO2_12_FULL_45_26 TaxID=1798525 RepID=A0A1F6FG48_9BACT|nr:MAG: hypothetical protein A2929_00210 [Candidatus Kaiserbacteria bacterium RIFCSPLOWO2_01_FULL_45_25]OGG84318.1 MAG: hypothetical protein A3I99_00865 [Candidatus Kaiserbacteria bacterium RIFCSPLOWO2_02_FULL_45_11b]OGG84826.1 MAG: hypothetical protein A3G90_01970 [Candidatus Kaiserbacteria bacterium RIFCSPLOWO2_12_FULL_45_26]